jgi:hypothetical protein
MKCQSESSKPERILPRLPVLPAISFESHRIPDRSAEIATGELKSKSNNIPNLRAFKITYSPKTKRIRITGTKARSFLLSLRRLLKNQYLLLNL